MTEQGNSRLAFLQKARAVAVEHFDQTAQHYDDQFAEVSAVHLQSLEQFLARLGPSPSVLDAACGTGRYFGLLAGRIGRLVGVDQSAMMLARAAEKYPDIETRKVSMQDLRVQSDLMDSFDGVMCIDAMEWILRHDWPAVLEGFNRVLRPLGHAYLTVEIPGNEERRELAQPPISGAARGEVRVKHWYNHFPSAEDVSEWLDKAGFLVQLELRSEYYRHLILQRRV